ncbi:paeninodin family lasso peptide [Paenibacillus sp. GCM10023250]|uniref:paeninodin family lasso peptide n=1 Tax=Paenibacillus sp. GCM10023250 TaxID=3252648 RepID=UPI003611A138
MKKVWQQPKMEVLSVNETMLGFGSKLTDWTYVGGVLDTDQYDPGNQTGGNSGPIPVS